MSPGVLIFSIIIVLVIGIAAIVFIMFTKPSDPIINSGNFVYDATYMRPTWFDGQTPYVFQLDPPSMDSVGTLVGSGKLNYFDSQGYEQGMSSFTVNYRSNGPFQLIMNITSTIRNYSGVTPPAVWTVSLVGQNIKIENAKFTKTLRAA